MVQGWQTRAKELKEIKGKRQVMTQAIVRASDYHLVKFTFNALRVGALKQQQ